MYRFRCPLLCEFACAETQNANGLIQCPTGVRAAIANATDPVEVTLLDNVTLNSTLTISKDVTLDLNGKTLTGNGTKKDMCTATMTYPITKGVFSSAGISSTSNLSGYKTVKGRDGNTYYLVGNAELPDYLRPLPEHTVTFDLNGGDGAAPAAQTVTQGEKATKPADPKRVGYTFAGWFTDDGVEYKYTEAVTEGITLYAHWTKCEQHQVDLWSRLDKDYHEGTCVKCGETVTEKHSQWSAWTPNENGTQHTRECGVCSGTQNVNHADKNTDHKCDTCSYEMSEHVWGDWEPGANGHTHTCIDCGATQPQPSQPTPPAATEPDGVVDIPDEEPPLTDIPDADVPLAPVPGTGDISYIWGILALISGAGLAVLVLKNKKREENAE